MRFDYYGATIRDTPDAVVSAISEQLGAEVREARGMHSYEKMHELVTSTGVACRVLSGGRNPYPHAFASGEDCDDFVPLVRAQWPDLHSVSRVDAEQDWDGDGAWDALVEQLLTLADEKSLRIDQQGDWIRAEAGRTLYLGARTSPTRVRCYEKGIQLRQQVTSGADDISPDWVRLEVQSRPVGTAKWVAAKATPDEVWGYSAWSRELVLRCFGLDVPRVAMHVYREASDVRARYFMLRQYRAVLARLAEEQGSWAAAGEWLGRMVDRA